MRCVVLISLFFCFGLQYSLAQESAVSSGKDINGSGGSIAYSVGQIVSSTHNGSTGSMQEGVQQTYSITTLIESSDFSFSVYPNPASNSLILKTNATDRNNLYFVLSNLEGKIVSSGRLNEESTIIDVSMLASATYFLKVTDNQKLIQSFKIVKN